MNSALNLAIQFNHDEQKASILQAVGVAYQSLNRLPEALWSFEDSLTIKRKVELKNAMASNLSAIAQVHQTMGHPDLARPGYLEALKLLEGAGDKAGAAGVMDDLGNFYTERGEYDKAMALFKEYLKNQTELRNEQGQGLALNNIGCAYLSKGDYDDAHTYLEQALERREKFQEENDIADTLHNLAETSTSLGLFDEATAQYLRALQLRRKLGDRRGEAIENYSLGTVFALKGRLAAAESARLEALNFFNESAEKAPWLASGLMGYGSALSCLGKSPEAEKQFNQALQLAHELKNETLVAKITELEGDDAFYRGDLPTARVLYQQASRTASRTTDKQLKLTLRFDLSKLAIEEGKQDKRAISNLQLTRQEANNAGLRYLVLECSWYLAKSLLLSKQNAQPQSELQRVLLASQKMGADELVMRCHFLLGQAASSAGNKKESQLQFTHTSLSGRTDLLPILAGHN